MDNYIIRWNQALSVGDEYIDSQHERFVELIGGVYDHNVPRDGHILSEVLAYVNVHFADEEEYMKRLGYPGLREHAFEHKKLTRILLAYKDEYDHGRQDLYAFKQFTFRWVRDHIMDEDRRIADYVSHRKKPG